MPRRFAVACLAMTLAVPAFVAKAQDGDAAKPKKITIDADHEPLLAVIKKLCGAEGFNYVVSDAAGERAGSLSVHLTDVSFDDAIESICDVYGLDARVHGTIVVVRLREPREAGREDTHVPARSREVAAPVPAARESNTFLPAAPPPPEKATREAPPAPQPVTGAATAEVTSQARVVPPLLTSGGGAIVSGLVVDVTADSLKVKESSGDPRDFYVATGPGSDEARSSRLLQGLKRLKKGDRIALEYRSDGQRAWIANLVGGGKP